MSKKITHEEARLWATNLGGINNRLLHYIAQQEEQEQLLKLYKRLLEEGAFIPNLKGHRTLSEIKELENDV